jgi:hypothetical protein
MNTKEVLKYIRKHYEDGMIINCVFAPEEYAEFYYDELLVDDNGYGIYIYNINETRFYIYDSKEKKFSNSYVPSKKNRIILVEKKF